MNPVRIKFLAPVVTISLLCTTAPSASMIDLYDSPHAQVLPARVVALRHTPGFILQAVARRMGIALLPGVPTPTILLESKTPLSRLQAAVERQWGFRPPVFVTTFASAGNEIYLIDDAAIYERREGTPDDSLAHEFVHYLQAYYRWDPLDTDWSESEAVAIQTWFRKTYMAPTRATLIGRPTRQLAMPPLLSP